MSISWNGETLVYPYNGTLIMNKKKKILIYSTKKDESLKYHEKWKTDIKYCLPMIQFMWHSRKNKTIKEKKGIQWFTGALVEERNCLEMAEENFRVWTFLDHDSASCYMTIYICQTL